MRWDMTEGIDFGGIFEEFLIKNDQKIYQSNCLEDIFFQFSLINY